MDSITLDFVSKIITVTFLDESTKEYTDLDSYVADFPDRQADAVAMWGS